MIILQQSLDYEYEVDFFIDDNLCMFITENGTFLILEYEDNYIELFEHTNFQLQLEDIDSKIYVGEIIISGLLL
jgi:hypothetical protein